MQSERSTLFYKFPRFYPRRRGPCFFIPETVKSLKTAFRDQGTPPGAPSLPLSTGGGERPRLGPFARPTVLQSLGLTGGNGAEAR